MNIKAFVGAILVMTCIAAPGLAQPGPSLTPAKPIPAIAPITPPQQTAHALTKDDLEAWLDGYVPYALQRGNIAGAVVVVVKDGQVLLQKGFGYADVAKRLPVDPETTMFRPGSVSKLFTWTALMQLVEQGKVNLDADVNTYLDFKIPPFQGQPVTVRNLMTHTAGFQESVKELISADPKGPPPLAEFIKAYVPARIFPPGQVPAYSNYGAALGGYIVQRVSGQPFDDYIQQHIFAPLGMDHTTFRQPLPAKFAQTSPIGYQLASGPSKPYEMIALAPAGSSVSTGADMAKFMMAHLQDGEYQGHRILQPATAQMMHTTPLTIISPALHRMLLGFYETDRNGHHIIGHGGDSRWFHSDLQLFPADHVGLFISMNSAGAGDAREAIREALLDGFTDRYFPGPAPQGHVDAAMAKADAATLAGDYEVSRREQTNFLSLVYLLQQAKVVTDKAGHIIASPVQGLNGQPRTFEEIAPFIWREVGGKALIAAKVDNGKVVMWGEDASSPFTVYMPVPGYRNGAWLMPAVELSVAALLLSAVLWPVGALLRRRYGAGFSLQGLPAHSYRAVRVAALASGVLMLVWFMTVVTMLQNFALGTGMDPWILSLHVLSIVVFPLAALVAIGNVWVVCTNRTGWRSAFAWSWSVALALSTLILLWVALVFHLIGLGLIY